MDSSEQTKKHIEASLKAAPLANEEVKHHDIRKQSSFSAMVELDIG